MSAQPQSQSESAELNRLKNDYESERAARQQAESLLEAKTQELVASNQELVDLRHQLEELVHQRTEEIKDARDQAIASSEAKSLFLANMSHEIRTPMNGILSVLNLIDGKNLSDRQKRLMQTAKTSGELLLTIINDILDVSKIESGNLTIEVLEFSLPDLIQVTAESIQFLAKEKGIELITYVDPEITGELLGDPTRVKQVIMNLMSNAIKFTHEGEVTLSAFKRENGIEITVSDTGIGLTEEQIDSIFTPFAQADNTVTRKYGGTGLGLSICNHLTKLMGQPIRVESEYGKGSAFSFILQLPENEESIVVPRESNLDFSDKRVLIVDKNLASQKNLAQKLRDLGIQHIALEQTAEHAFKLCQDSKEKGEPTDILFLDMALEGTSSQSLAEQLKSHFKRDIKIIALDGTEHVFDTDTFFAQLDKPINPFNLMESVESCFSERESLPADASIEPTYTTDMQQAPILLVDDNAINREVGKEILISANCSVDTCNDGAEAVNQVKLKTYAAILMDIQMPVMDGLTATRKIRSLGGKFEKLPIIAMTAHVQKEDIDKSLEAGMNAHLTKPIDSQILFETLSKFVSAKTKVPSPIRGDLNQNEIELDFNFDEALVRVNNNRTVLARIMNVFLRSHREDAVKISASLSQKNWGELKTISHTLKGSCANIGALATSKAAASVEQSCKASAFESIEAEVEALLSALKLSIDTIEQYVSENQGHSEENEKSALSTEDLTQALNKLADYIETDLGKAQEIIEELERSDHESIKQYVIALRDAFDVFDTDTAKETIETWHQAIASSGKTV